MKTAVEKAVDALRLWSDAWNEFDKTGKNKPQSIEEVIAPFIQMEMEQIVKHSVELTKILISNPFEKSGKYPKELVDNYFKETFRQ